MNACRLSFLRHFAAYLVLGLLSLLPVWSLADVTVGGSIAANTTWSAAQGPYNVSSDLTIDDGATLTIEAGTVLRMGPGVNLIVNNGSLRIAGRAAAPVVITSAAGISGGTPAPGDWGLLVFRDNTNDTNTLIEWAEIRFGGGVKIESASPTLNYVAIENHAAPAISLDLMSSPSGIGLTASGNLVNGISVPAGELLGSVSWKLRGIPYVVEGEVSVGKKPRIAGISPSSIQQGMSIDAVITGTRLAGIESINFDAAGVTATIGAGATDTFVPLHITASATQPLGSIGLEAMTAAGRVRLEGGIAVIPVKPTIGISSISPGSLRRGESKTFQIVGSSLQGAQIIPPAGGGLMVSNVSANETQATFSLAASANAMLGSQGLTLSNPEVANSAVAAVTVEPAQPKINTNPTTLATSPNGEPYSFAVTLTNTDNVAHTLNLSTFDPTIATVSPATVTIPASATQATVSVTGLKLGTTLLNITSPTLASVSVQLYVTNALSGGSVGPVLSPVVGVSRVVDASTLPAGSSLGPIISGGVGVDRVLDPNSLPVGASLGPVMSAPVSVERIIDPSSLPVGMTLGPVLSPAIGVDRPIEPSELPGGINLGPILSPVVGVEN